MKSTNKTRGGGTRCFIGIEEEDFSVKMVFCHFDGYPEGVGKTLLQHYSDLPKLRKLLLKGHMYGLGDELKDVD